MKVEPSPGRTNTGGRERFRPSPAAIKNTLRTNMNRIDPGEGGGGGGQAGLKGFLQRKGVGGALEGGELQ